MTKPTAGAATPKTRAGKPARGERERDHGLSDHDGGVSVPTKRERPGDALATIGRLSRDDLVRHWSSAHGRPPPKGISRRLLEFAAAYHLQSKAMGGLKPGTRRTLLRVAAARKQIKAPASPTRGRHLAPGARLLREWHGRTYRVDVLDSGFEHEGRHYRSLS